MAHVIPAQGRTANFGCAYNDELQKFTGLNVIIGNLPDDCVDTIDEPKVRQIITSRNPEFEKIAALDIKSEFKYQFLNVDSEGRFARTANNKNSEKIVQFSYVLSVSTKKQTLKWNRGNIPYEFSSAITAGCTHIVTGIKYGGNAFVRVSQEVKDGSNTALIEGALRGKMNNMLNKDLKSPESNNGLITGMSKSEENLKDDTMDIEVEADGFIEPDDNITTLKRAMEYVNKLCDRLKQYNGGNGVQIAFEMTPLETIPKHDTSIIQVDHVRNPVERKKEDLEARWQELVSHKKYVCSLEWELFQNEKFKLDKQFKGLQAGLKETLTMFRNKDQRAQGLLDDQEEKFETFKNDVQEYLDKTLSHQLKFSFIKLITDEKIRYIHQEEELAEMMLSTSDLNICFYSNHTYQSQKSIYGEFIEESRADRNKFIIIDADILEKALSKYVNIADISKNIFYTYKKGKYSKKRHFLYNIVTSKIFMGGVALAGLGILYKKLSKEHPNAEIWMLPYIFFSENKLTVKKFFDT